MENLNAITSFFAGLWDVFAIEHPLLGIPFSTIYIGVFAVGFSIMILKPILSIGGGVVDNISGSARNAARSAKSRRESIARDREAQARAEYNKSYAAYYARRKKNDEYKMKYKRGEKP